MILGIVGQICSGKDEVTNYLEKKGYKKVVLSDIIREEVLKRNLGNNVHNLIKIGNLLREKYGNGILVKRALEKYKDNVIINGIRNIGELEEIKKHKNSFIIAVIASKEIRLKRFLERSRSNDDLTEEGFNKIEEKQSSNKKNEININECIELSDFKIENNFNNKEELYKKINKLLLKL